MLVVTKLINVHFRWCGIQVKWSFKTVYDNTLEQKKHYIVTSRREKEVTKKAGNQLYLKLRKHFPDLKQLVIIDTKADDVYYVRVCEHYEIRLGDALVCTCDTLPEAREAKEQLRERLKA